VLTVTFSSSESLGGVATTPRLGEAGHGTLTTLALLCQNFSLADWCLRTNRYELRGSVGII
jgi:hypothetical protein